MPHQITKQRETYAAVVDELQDLKNWLYQCYEAEADAEIHEVEQCGEDIWKMSRPRVSKDLRLGNEDLYVALEKKETRPKLRPASSEFEGGNSLSPQWCWELESMEKQKYTLSQDGCASPDMHIPSPQPIDKSKVAKSVAIKKRRFQWKNTTPGDNANEWRKNARRPNVRRRRRKRLSTSRKR